ncbi:MAG: PIN domain-containing protein [Gammaproteobacteria bacterium]|nr:PIN domain-containing protein [Gammaproteobacteria bacterium]
MTEGVFFDTNILVYAYDTSDPAKQKIAKDLILKNIRNAQGWLSIQVFGEFFNVVTKRIPEPLTSEEAREAISALSLLKITKMDMKLVYRAIDTHQKYGTTYWDSMIISAAERSKCSRLFSEDFNSSQKYYGIIADNPFL